MKFNPTRPYLLLALCTFLAAACSKSSNNNTPTASTFDASFMVAASYANQDEIASSKLAVTQSTSLGVTGYAGTLVADHTAAESTLATLADSLHVTLPGGPDSAHLTANTILTGMSGATFDTSYIHLMIRDHQAAIVLFQSEIDSGMDAGVKTYATLTLPKLQMHLQAADSLYTVLQTNPQ